MITSLNNVPEAPTLTTNKNVLYYHKKSGGVFNIFMKYRTGTTGIEEADKTKTISVYPNPNNGSFTIKGNENETILIGDQLGREIKTIVLSEKNNFTERVSGLNAGIYFLTGKSFRKKIIITE